MSALDEKLREKLDITWGGAIDLTTSKDFRDAQGNLDEDTYLKVKSRIFNEAIEQIKQAFIDEGWSTPVNQDDLINFGTEENPVMIHKDSLPFSPSERGGYIDIPKDLRMTGLEWYERFVNELQMGDDSVWVLGAARRASGIKE